MFRVTISRGSGPDNEVWRELEYDPGSNELIEHDSDERVSLTNTVYDLLDVEALRQEGWM
jgi:hypothetical protein